ncbi:MAG: OmpH family outer membrane protein [Prevotellaceae bacterium]|jgi:outer membrane protein|nr:OmpH family outer membrane protein [Prevotellaceae bacterium]
MKKLSLITVIALLGIASVSAQKVALVDMEYILKNIPMYESANEQLKQISQKWQSEVEAKNEEAKNLYKNYQTEVVFLSDEMKARKENEIVAKEKEANELKRTYFGPDGELFKKRESLMKPIQDEIYTAIKAVSEEKKYELILDKTSGMNIIYYSSKIDISDEVLTKLGYSKK